MSDREDYSAGYHGSSDPANLRGAEKQGALDRDSTAEAIARANAASPSSTNIYTNSPSVGSYSNASDMDLAVMSTVIYGMVTALGLGLGYFWDPLAAGTCGAVAGKALSKVWSDLDHDFSYGTRTMQAWIPALAAGAAGDMAYKNPAMAPDLTEQIWYAKFNLMAFGGGATALYVGLRDAAQKVFSKDTVVAILMTGAVSVAGFHFREPGQSFHGTIVPVVQGSLPPTDTPAESRRPQAEAPVVQATPGRAFILGAPYADASDTPGGEVATKMPCGTEVGLTGKSDGDYAQVEIMPSGHQYYMARHALVQTMPKCGG